MELLKTPSYHLEHSEYVEYNRSKINHRTSIFEYLELLVLVWKFSNNMRKSCGHFQM